MTRNIALIWFAGLFEGEGCFTTSKGFSKGLMISSTDLDVLERIKLHFGGNICAENRSNKPSNWKEVNVWYIKGQPSIDLFDEFKIHLLSRRLQRGEEWKQMYEDAKLRKIEKAKTYQAGYQKVVDLRSQGLTHQQIADIVGCERSNVTKILIDARNNVNGSIPTCDVD